MNITGYGKMPTVRLDSSGVTQSAKLMLDSLNKIGNRSYEDQLLEYQKERTKDIPLSREQKDRQFSEQMSLNRDKLNELSSYHNNQLAIDKQRLELQRIKYNDARKALDSKKRLDQLKIELAAKEYGTTPEPIDFTKNVEYKDSRVVKDYDVDSISQQLETIPNGVKVPTMSKKDDFIATVFAGDDKSKKETLLKKLEADGLNEYSNAMMDSGNLFSGYKIDVGDTNYYGMKVFGAKKDKDTYKVKLPTFDEKKYASDIVANAIARKKEKDKAISINDDISSTVSSIVDANTDNIEEEFIGKKKTLVSEQEALNIINGKYKDDVSSIIESGDSDSEKVIRLRYIDDKKKQDYNRYQSLKNSILQKEKDKNKVNKELYMYEQKKKIDTEYALAKRKREKAQDLYARTKDPKYAKEVDKLNLELSKLDLQIQKIAKEMKYPKQEKKLK